MQPDRRVAAGVAPENVGIAVADQFVATLPSDTDEATAPPFIFQSARLPALSRHRIALPRLPTIDQSVETLATSTAEDIAAPFISQTATLPLLSRQRMSPLPSLLKGAGDRPAGADIADERTRNDAGPVHQPNRDITGAVSPEDLGRAVTVEVS